MMRAMCSWLSSSPKYAACRPVIASTPMFPLPAQAGGWVPTPSGGPALQRTGSGRVLAPAEKKRRGAVLRLFDALRCGRFGWV